MSKFVGIGPTLLTTIFCFVIFKICLHGERDLQIIYGGLVLIILSGLPFIFLGAMLSIVLDNRLKTRSLKYNILIYSVLGAFISFLVILFLKLYDIQVAGFVFTDSIIGAIVFYLSSHFIKSKIFGLILGIVFPVIILVVLFSLLK